VNTTNARPDDGVSQVRRHLPDDAQMHRQARSRWYSGPWCGIVPESRHPPRSFINTR